MRFSLLTTLLSLLALACAQWQVQFHDEYKCGAAVADDINTAPFPNGTAVVQACTVLTTPFKSARQVSGSIPCAAVFHQREDCSDTGCQSDGLCCSPNNKKYSWAAYQVICV